MALKDTITKDELREIVEMCHRYNFMAFEMELTDGKTGETCKVRYDNPYFICGQHKLPIEKMLEEMEIDMRGEK